MANRCKSAGFQIAVVIIGFSATSLCGFVSIMWFPQLVFYPAVFCVFIIQIVKILSVFCPTPGIKQLSSRLSWAESSGQASIQLLLLIFISLTSGKFYYSAMISSIVLIGKVRAENYLTSGPEDLLKDKSFIEKIALVLRFLPLFSLTGFFRSGAYVVSLLNFHSSKIFSGPSLILLVFFYDWILYSLFMILFFGLRRMMPELRDLTVMEVTVSLNEEGTTISTWGSLGRRGARRLQMAMNTIFLLIR